MSEQGDAVDRRECEELLRFETLLTDLSARFINLPAEQLDAAIEDAQRRICECLGLDLAVLWQWEVDSPGVFTLTHHYCRLDGPPISSQLQASESFPWCLQEVLAGRSHVITSMDDVPEGAERDQESWRYFGLKNVVIFPLSAGGEAPFGAISFHDMVTPRTWSESVIKRLELIAQVFANAIVRKRTEQSLRESEERLALATEAAGAGTWVLDATGTRFLTGAKALEVLGLPPGDSMTVEDFFALVHPDDRQSVRNTIAEAVQSREMKIVEYRIVRPNGEVRWMASRGRMCSRADAEPMRLTGIISDITARKQSEEDRRKSEFRLASAIEVAGLGLYEEEGPAEDRTTIPDPRVRSVAGIPENLVDRGMREYWLAHVHPDDRQRVTDWVRGFEEAGGSDLVSTEYRYLHEDRGPVWLRHVVHALARNAAGRVVRLIGVLQDVTEQKTAEQKLRQALDEVRTLRDQLHSENLYLREQMRSEPGHGTIVGESPPVKRMLALARKVGPTESAVLITGETGTGKELLAQAIHDLSSRGKKIMVKVNCAALPAPLIESELFGREKGAYTGAMAQQAGRFELANGSTIFLDEIGDLPLDLQVKLLRVLQDGLYERLGSNRTRKADVRVIAATNRDLTAMVREGRFREDLFHRLNVFLIEAPPLRTRVDDIPLLAWTFIHEFNVKMGRSIDSVPRSTMERLKQYPWPGNVRELRNVIERAMILSEGRSLTVELPETDSATASLPSTLQALERKHILKVLERTHWRIRGKKGAAEILGLVPTTLHSRMKKLGISRPAHSL